MEKQQDLEKDNEKEKELTQEWNDDKQDNNNNAYSLFLYGLRSPVTRDYYLRRSRIFLNHISLLPGGDFGYKCRNCNTINRITLEDGDLKKQE